MLGSTIYHQHGLWSEDSHVKICLSPDGVLDLEGIGAAYGTNITVFSLNSDLSGWLSKTFPVYCPAVPLTSVPDSPDEALTSQLCWRDLPESYRAFLQTVGQKPASDAATSMTWHGGVWTLKIGVSHSGANGCLLSDILLPAEAVPQKYYLSPTAERGILRRAEKRGKVLPEALAQVLSDVAASGGAPTLPSLKRWRAVRGMENQTVSLWYPYRALYRRSQALLPPAAQG